MIEVKNRSEESWGPLAKCDEDFFNRLIKGSREPTKERIKEHLKKQKKLKTYEVTFKKVWNSDSFEIQAESEYEVSSAAREYFKDNHYNIGFKEPERGKWAGDYAGYDSISYVKVK